VYLRLPDGFISIAIRTISSRPFRRRCCSARTNSQIPANLSKSVCLDDINGYARKCGRILSTRLRTFRTSNFTVLSDLSGRMNPHPHLFWIETRNVGIQIHRLKTRAGVLWPRGHPGISTPESLRGFDLRRILPSVLPAMPLHEASEGFHRFEPVVWNGVATVPGNVTYPTRNFATLGPFLVLINPALLPF
jgi:hypothetical protein